VGSPSNLTGIPQSLQNPAYATAVGLVLWASKNNTQNGWKRKPFGFLGVFSLVSKLRSLFKRK